MLQGDWADPEPAKVEAAAAIQEVDNWLDDTIRLTRQLTVELNPPLLKEEGLVAALTWLVRPLDGLYGFHVALHAT